MIINTSILVSLPVTADVLQTSAGHLAFSSVVLRDPGAVLAVPLSMLPASVQSVIVEKLADEAQSMLSDQSSDQFNDWLLGARDTKAA